MTRLLLGLGFACGAVVFAVTRQWWWAALVVSAGVAAVMHVERGPRLFPEDMRRAIYARDGGRCASCGVAVHWERDCPYGECERCYQADHVKAWANGGRTTLRNGACLCRACNQAKSDA